MHPTEILGQGPVRCDRAQASLPGMQVGVDKARYDDEVRRIHEDGFRRLKRLPQGRDTRAVDQDVAAKVTLRLVHRDDKCVLDQCVSHSYSLSVCRLQRRFNERPACGAMNLTLHILSIYAIDCINVRLLSDRISRCLPPHQHSCRKAQNTLLSLSLRAIPCLKITNGVPPGLEKPLSPRTRVHA